MFLSGAGLTPASIVFRNRFWERLFKSTAVIKMHVHNNIVLSRIIKRRRYFGTEIYVPDNEPGPGLVFRGYALNTNADGRNFYAIATTGK